MIANVFQLLVIVLLAFVLIFGTGFIFNMLLKTTWAPVYIYVALVAAVLVYFEWGSGNFWTGLASYGAVDWLTAAGGLAGAYVSGLAIKTLRARGYKMF